MYLKPKPKYNTPINIKVTTEADIIFRTYASYLGVSIDEMFIQVADNFITDPEFLEYAKDQRFNKKIMRVINGNCVDEDDKDEEKDEIPF